MDVRGYRNEFFAIGDVDSDTADFNNTGHFSDGEVHFRGSTTLDNGLEVGVQVELEAFTAGDQIDENYAFFSGSFGRLVLGSENTAPYQGFWSVTAPNVGIPISSGWITTFVPQPAGHNAGFRTPGLTTNVDIVNDDNIISYYTPRFNGFQLTASYVPTSLINGDGKNFPVQANEDTELHNGFAVGLHFTESFNGLDFTAAGAFNYIDACDGGACSGGVFDDELYQWKAGLNLGYGGFSIGGSYAGEDSDRTSAGWSVDAGASYSTGPWGVSVTYFHSDIDGIDTDEDADTLHAITGAVAYDLGPGIDVSASFLYATYDEEGGNDTDGYQFIVGTRISY